MNFHSHNPELIYLHTKLSDARKRSREITKEIAHLKTQIRSLGGDPSGKQHNAERNLKMYAAYQSNIALADIAAEYNLSAHRVKEICKRIAARK